VEIERGLVRTKRCGHIHYRAAGGPGAPPVMLFHINAQSSALMLELMAALAPALRVVAMDYPSHGHSDPIAWQPTIGDYAATAIEVMDSLGIERAFALGEAVGSLVATEISGAYPGRIAKTVLVNCPFLPGIALKDTEGDVTADHRPADPSGFPLTRTIDFVLERDPAHAPMHPTQSWMDRINVAQVEAGRNRWQALDALRRYDLAVGLGRIRCPVLLLMGEHFCFRRHTDDLLRHVRDIPEGRARSRPAAERPIVFRRLAPASPPGRKPR
jgi:pimeloyl-ACP methyl ester carboxylesterase